MEAKTSSVGRVVSWGINGADKWTSAYLKAKIWISCIYKIIRNLAKLSQLFQCNGQYWRCRHCLWNGDREDFPVKKKCWRSLVSKRAHSGRTPAIFSPRQHLMAILRVLWQDERRLHHIECILIKIWKQDTEILNPPTVEIPVTRRRGNMSKQGGRSWQPFGESKKTSKLSQSTHF